MKLQEHINLMKKMNDKYKLEYAFQNYYESNEPDIKDSFFLIIAHLISQLELSLNTSKLNNISEETKQFIIDSAYNYIYKGLNSIRGPINNIFGEILLSEEPYIEPYLELIKVVLKTESKKI